MNPQSLQLPSHRGVKPENQTAALKAQRSPASFPTTPASALLCLLFPWSLAAHWEFLQPVCPSSCHISLASHATLDFTLHMCLCACHLSPPQEGQPLSTDTDDLPVPCYFPCTWNGSGHSAQTRSNEGTNERDSGVGRVTVSKAHRTWEQAPPLSHLIPLCTPASLALIQEQATRTGGLSLVPSPSVRRHPGPLAPCPA